MDSQSISSIANSTVAESAVKHLWPTMLFIVIMSLISLIGSKWWLSSVENSTSYLIAFWLWFSSLIIVNGIGTIIFFQDARIQFAKSNIKK